MFAHKHGPRAPVFTVVMAALSYSTNRPSLILQRGMFVFADTALIVQFLCQSPTFNKSEITM